MRASVGDRVIVDGTTPGTARRDGEVVALRHPGGTPPYEVRWSDTGRTTLFFPGPDAHLHHFAGHHPAEARRSATGAPAVT